MNILIKNPKFMENLSVVLGIGLIIAVAYLIKLSIEKKKQKKYYEQMLSNVKEIMDNVSVVEYVALESFTKSHCEQKKAWTNLYNYLFT